MMDLDAITKNLKNVMCSDLNIEVRSANRFMIHTGHTYPDGDELHILLVEDADKLLFTDEGHTMMWLSYEDFKMTDSRRDVLDRTLRSNGASLSDGELSIVIGDDMACALESLMRTELQVADLLYLDKEIVRDTFMEDLRDKFVKSDIADRCKYDYTIVADDDTTCHADIFIENKIPILVFGIHTSMQCARATVAMLSLNKNGTNYLFMTVFDNNSQISSNDRNKAINACMKTIIGVNEAINGAHMLLGL